MIKKIINKENKGFTVMSLDASKSMRVHDHMYESNLLCAQCDNKILGSYEDYGSKFLYGNLGKKDAIDITTQELHFDVQKVNYHKLKLFFLSILWKCSISKTFDLVKLNANDEERIRQLLHSATYSTEAEFPIVFWNYASARSIPQEFILPPWISDKNDGECNFHFLGGGIFLQIILEYKVISDICREAMLKETGAIKVINVPSPLMKPIINKIVGWNWLA